VSGPLSGNTTAYGFGGTLPLLSAVLARACPPTQTGHVEQWSAGAPYEITLSSGEAREAEQRVVPPEGQAVCVSLSGSCSLWVVRVVTLIPLGP